MTPRVRRFLLLVGGFTAFLAFSVLTPLKIWAGIMLVVCLAVALGLCWFLARDPFPWSKKPPNL